MNTSKLFLEIQARVMAETTNCFASALLALGHEGRMEEFTPKEQALIKRVKRFVRPERQQCFANSQRAIAFFYGKLPEGRFEYVEGYATAVELPIPIQHAWLELNGKVVDLTGDFSNYFGMTICVTTVQNYMLEGGMHGPLLDDGDLGYKYTALLLTPGIRDGGHGGQRPKPTRVVPPTLQNRS